MKKIIIIIHLLILNFSTPIFAQTDIDGLLFLLEESYLRKEKIDHDVASKQYGFKDFKDFVDQYSKTYEIENLTVKQVKEYLQTQDTTIEIKETQENLNKLHSLIINDKTFRGRTSYFKKKYAEVPKMLVVYIDYKKEMAKITKNPDIKKISRFGFRFRYGGSEHGMKQTALKDCEEKIVEKYKLFGGECIIVEYREGKSFKNLLKPMLQKPSKQIVQQKPKLELNFTPVTVVDHVNLLGVYSKPSRYPKGMLKELGKGNKSFEARAMEGARKMSLIFRRNETYNQRHPGDIFFALAYFELFYQFQLKKKERNIKRFLKYWPQKKREGKTIVTLIKFNKAREKMRKALGMDLNTSTEEAMETFWTLGEYLNKGKIIKQKVHTDIKVRKKLLIKYKNRVKAFNAKIEKEKDNKLFDKIYIPTDRKFKLWKLKRKNI